MFYRGKKLEFYYLLSLRSFSKKLYVLRRDDIMFQKIADIIDRIYRQWDSVSFCENWLNEMQQMNT